MSFHDNDLSGLSNVRTAYCKETCTAANGEEPKMTQTTTNMPRTVVAALHYKLEIERRLQVREQFRTQNDTMKRLAMSWTYNVTNSAQY